MNARLLVIFAVLLPLYAAAEPASDTQYATARSEFQSAYTAAKIAPTVDNDDSPALRAYPLYPYLQAARLQRALAQQPLAEDLDARIAAFVSAQDGAGNTPILRDLRRAWLLNLADRGAWATFSAQYRDGTGDITLRCHAVTARIEADREDGLPAAASELWLTGDTTPRACDPAFDWLRAHAALTPALIDQRARLALRAGNLSLARSLAAQLPDTAAAPLLQWAALIDKPERELPALILAPARAVEPEALLDGWSRLARRDPDQAQLLYPALREARKLDDATASPYARALALGLSWSRRPALAYFAQIAAAELDAVSAEWRLRSALWAGDWPQVAQFIAALPESLRTQQRWRYWGLRAAEALGADNIRPQFVALAGEDGWYPALASAHLNRPYTPPNQTVAMDAAQQAQLAARPALVRAHELYLCTLKNLAAQEWAQALEMLTPAQRVQAVGLAVHWGWFDQAVATASGQKIFTDYSLLYPRPYLRAVQSGAEASGVPEDLIYAILRQESLYRSDAVSHANAIGLMQLLRETAARTAKRVAKPAPTTAALYDPDTNITLGSAHLRELIDRFDGQRALAIAAYNAGPNAVKRWLPEMPIDADIWIENIPYNETRTYVQRVQWHALVFGWLRTGKPQMVNGWLMPVGIAEPAVTAATEASR